MAKRTIQCKAVCAESQASQDAEARSRESLRQDIANNEAEERSAGLGHKRVGLYAALVIAPKSTDVEALLVAGVSLNAALIVTLVARLSCSGGA